MGCRLGQGEGSRRLRQLRPAAGLDQDDRRQQRNRIPLWRERSPPTAIVELAADERVHRVTAIYKTKTQGRFDVYLLEDMDKSSTDLNYRKPVASATDENGDGIVEIDFDPEGARFIAVRFTPAESFAGNFEIVEINAYCDLPLAMLDALEAPDVYTEMAAATFPGEGDPDISTKLGVIAIPPTLPPVSQ